MFRIHHLRMYFQRGSGSDFLKLTEADGIDVLGNLIEASSLSVNQSFYGNYHNFGHNMLAFLHDPDYRFQVQYYFILGPSALPHQSGK
jgi:hypothetical protein